MAATKFLDYDGLIYFWQQIKSNFSNTIDGITVNGATVTPTNKVVALTIPTSSDINSAIAAAIAGITGVSFEIVQSLPTTDISLSTIYLVPNSGSGTNSYDEYIRVAVDDNGSTTYVWEMLGTTAVDLSGYWKGTGTDNNSLVAMTNQEISAAITAAEQSA